MNSVDENKTPPLQEDTPQLSQYIDRAKLNNEVHSRPFIAINSPSRCTSIAMLHNGTSLEQEWMHILELCHHFGVSLTTAPENHLIVEFNSFRLKWERHTEFSSYTFIREGVGDVLFKNTALEVIPKNWISGMPGEMFVGVHLTVIKSTKENSYDPDEILEVFGHQSVVGSEMSENCATAWTDFQLHQDGFSRILIKNISMKERQTGRLLQRLWEIESYRMLSLLALPLTQEVGEQTRKIESILSQNVGKMSDVHDADEEQKLLETFTSLAAKVEELSAATSFRFNASKAYYSLVKTRTENIKEKKIDGIQRVSVFMERRLGPAMRTVSSMDERIASLSRRVNRASGLLQTRINTTLQAQNKELLYSMNQRAQLQLNLQQTVEGLSVVAISYYALSIINIIAEAAAKIWQSLDPTIITASFAPLIIGGVYLGIKRIRKTISK